MEKQMEVVIQESPGGHWNILIDGEKVNSDGFFRRAADAQEHANAEGWVVIDVRKHGEE